MTSTISYQPQETKFCNTCNHTKLTSNFYKDVSKPDGFSTQCKICKSKANNSWKQSNQLQNSASKKAWRENNKSKVNANNAKRRATKLQATPGWCEVEQIKELYTQSEVITEETGILHHVDHIVPLQSDIVSGLHCLANLQIIPAVDNLSKNNHHWPDMP
jgi:hypothetical protein